jgi:hypothetical protein
MSNKFMHLFLPLRNQSGKCLVMLGRSDLFWFRQWIPKSNRTVLVTCSSSLYLNLCGLCSRWLRLDSRQTQRDNHLCHNVRVTIPSPAFSASTSAGKNWSPKATSISKAQTIIWWEKAVWRHPDWMILVDTSAWDQIWLSPQPRFTPKMPTFTAPDMAERGQS